MMTPTEIVATDIRRINPKVYVVAWSFENGGGFDWYFTADAASKAYAEEKENATGFKESSWVAYRFDFEVSPKSTNDEITNQIDQQLVELCESAAEVFCG